MVVARVSGKTGLLLLRVAMAGKWKEFKKELRAQGYLE